MTLNESLNHELNQTKSLFGKLKAQKMWVQVTIQMNSIEDENIIARKHVLCKKKNVKMWGCVYKQYNFK